MGDVVKLLLMKLVRLLIADAGVAALVVVLVALVKSLVQKLNESLPNGAPTRLYPAFNGFEDCLFSETSV